MAIRKRSKKVTVCICEAIKRGGKPCGYEWEPNGDNFPPAICPRCKSTHWNGKRNSRLER